MDESGQNEVDKVGEVTRTSRFDFGSGPDPDLAYQWNTKGKLFSLAEVCSLSLGCRCSFCHIELCCHAGHNCAAIASPSHSHEVEGLQNLKSSWGG